MCVGCCGGDGGSCGQMEGEATEFIATTLGAPLGEGGGLDPGLRQSAHATEWAGAPT